MRYEKIQKAEFVSRENRFVATVRLDGSRENTSVQTGLEEPVGELVKAHVKNTGRCRELLVPGATVWLEDHEGRMGTRKMRYSLVGVEKEPAGDSGGRLLINMDSQAPNKVVQEALQGEVNILPGLAGRVKLVKPEQTFGKSRFDFYVESGDEEDNVLDRAFIEVKGVTLEDFGFARFPDAPTERGLKHVAELVQAVREGFKAYIIFVIQMKDITGFGPNYETHPAFGHAMVEAEKASVQILAYDCIVTEDSLKLDAPVEVCLEEPADVCPGEPEKKER